MTTGEELSSGHDFPYLAHPKPRPGQIDMIRESREALRNGGYHLAAAPTGIGKTAAALAAALEIAEKTPGQKPSFSLPHVNHSIASLWIPFAGLTNGEPAKTP